MNVYAEVLMSKLSIEEFTNFFKYYKDMAHQRAAAAELWKAMPVSLLEDSAPWVLTYRNPVEEEVNGIVDAKMLERLTGHPAASYDANFVNDCNRLFADTGFDKHLNAMQMLMANMMHETCNFVYMKEIASGVAYNNRSDLGNGPDDGPRYKGAGVLQLTGKYNYQQLADNIHDPKVMQGVDYVSNTYPFTSARVWIEKNHLLDICLTQGFDACCVKINGGYNGIDDRRHKYAVCQREMF